MSDRIHKNTYWRSGVILESGENLALIRADRADRNITVAVKGDVVTRRDFMAIIRDQIGRINQSIPNLVVNKRIPVDGHANIFEDYDHLLNLERMGEESFVPRGLGEKVSVKSLLNGYESQSDRLERQMEEVKSKQDQGFKEIKEAIEDIQKDEKPESPEFVSDSVSNRDIYLFFIVLASMLVLWFGTFILMNSYGIDLWIVFLALVAITAFAAFIVNKLSEKGLVAILQSFKLSVGGDSSKND
jgi:hypothetical protein